MPHTTARTGSVLTPCITCFLLSLRAFAFSAVFFSSLPSGCSLPTLFPPACLFRQMRRHIRRAIRTFSQAPWFTFVALLTLALGIGVNSALFSVVKAVLIEDLPYGKPDQLIRVWVTN